jgi:hypothetical protein
MIAVALGNAAMGAQNLPDGAGRAWESEALGTQLGVLFQIIPDRLGARNAVNGCGWCGSDRQQAVNHNLAEAWWWVLARP